MPSKIQELISAGLFQRGLIDIESPELVRRYNACLAEIGLDKTALKRFKIDRMGWSPDIAEETDNYYYLAHGPSNPFAIILTPDQATAPIYFPTHSYDWEMTDTWFRIHRAQVADVTRDAALWLDMDQMVNVYEKPEDLLMVHEVVVKTHSTNSIIGEAIRQKGMITRFMQEPDAHLDSSLIERIKASGRKVGDLRARNCIIRDFHFPDVIDFYARVINGVFVLRSHGDEPIIASRDSQWAKANNIFVADAGLIDSLATHRYVECDFSWWRSHITYLETIAESLLMEVLDEEEPEMQFLSLNSAKQKGVIRKYGKKLGAYLSLMRIVDSIRRGEEPKQVPDDLAIYLLHPAKRLSVSSREVVEHLLSLIREGRLVQMFYRYQKTAFVDAYTKRWKAPRREWALTRIREHYDRLERLRHSAAA